MSTHEWVSRERVMKFLRSIFGVLANIEVIGGENIPDQGAFVLATSHISRLDTPFLMMSTTRKDVVGMVASNYKHAPFIGWFLSKLGVIWIDRDGYDFKAFREASAYLKKGGIVGLAPEGRRSKDGQLLEGKPGTVLLALRNKAQVIPAAVLGSADMMKRLLKLKKMQVKVIFGKPFDLPRPEEEQNGKDILELATTEIMCRIAALLPEERRGFYRDHQRLKVLLAAQQQ
ncbi:MAG: lysophospholipid acyltransferase family protein [Anaerolineaceae bacterium]|jgi:1-acyl-sn-glycerol-3-phosphate acyltransferase|nr:lysophospholipid acyltransferase family protein [Anaerolineaceae bacterium]MDD4042559.1 lysophospholipid acyltransferase family protein [Anaerolineaceae bacterium]MDD4578336.1 lysophospholipid acyltransferase family protein [Anaerolineaceae bacterium]